MRIHEWFQEGDSLDSKGLFILGLDFDILPTQSSFWLWECSSNLSVAAHLDLHRVHTLC